MSMTQTIVGGAIMVVLGSAVLQGVLPSPAPTVAQNQEYHSDGGLQDGAITSDVPFCISWSAQVVGAETNVIVHWCAGYGSESAAFTIMDGVQVKGDDK